jgi:hypothetical protein
MKLLAIFSAFLLASCASSGQMRTITFSGESHINKFDNIFQQDIMPKLIPYSSIVSGCKEPITTINTHIIEAPSNPTSNSSGQLTSGTFKERWNLSKCDKEVPIYVTVEFLPNGQSAHELSATP